MYSFFSASLFLAISLTSDNADLPTENSEQTFVPEFAASSLSTKFRDFENSILALHSENAILARYIFILLISLVFLIVILSVSKKLKRRLEMFVSRRKLDSGTPKERVVGSWVWHEMWRRTKQHAPSGWEAHSLAAQVESVNFRPNMTVTKMQVDETWNLADASIRRLHGNGRFGCLSKKVVDNCPRSN